MNVRLEINKYADPEDQPILLWLFDKYHMTSQWGFVAWCEFVRYGPASYMVHRRWHPKEEGKILYLWANGGYAK